MRAVLDVVVKDPKKLGDLVAEHNRRISNTNEGQLAVVRSLQSRRAKLTEERDRFVEAIGHGAGAVKILVAEIEKREKEMEELQGRIAEAEALVTPLLIPRAAAVKDYVAGSASLFENDSARDKEFLERVLEGIFVYADGTITLRFRESSLFAPVTSFGLQGDEQGSDATLAARRKLHRDLLANGLAQFEDCKNKPATVQVEQAHGLPFYRFDSPRGAKNRVGVPSGVEPALAT